MLQAELGKIFQNIQRSTSSHQKYVQILSNTYDSVPFEDFFSEFFKYVSVLLQQKIGAGNQPILKCFKFCASFSRHLIDQDAKKSGEVDLDASHPFLTRLLQELLKHHNLDYVQVRFHACQFIATLLLNISEDVTLDNDLCDDIQNAMLERITELKPPIRVQAAAALGRLQDVSNNNCPVIKAYVAALGDPSAMVRKEVIEKIAPCPLTFAKIIERTRDVDHTVRTCAFTKLTLIGPKVFKIIDRQIIALTGINEQHKAVKKSFVKMLVKWVSTYDDDYIKLLNALKLDADEEDFKQTTFIYEKILDIFCGINPVKEMFEILQVDENNLVTSSKFSIEVVMYWHHLLNYLEAKENLQEFYEFITPAPLPLFDCISGYIKEKTSSKLDDWEYIEFQHVLCKLFQIAKKIDLADETIRNTLRALAIKTMTEIKLDNLILTELINILKKIVPDVEQLSNEIFSVIAEIKEPLVEQGPDSYLVHEKDFKMAQVRVKLHIVQDELQEAVSKNEFLTAAAKQQEHAELEEKLKDLEQNFAVTTKVRKVQDDLKTTCRCFDIVISLLQNTEMQALPPSITQHRQEFVETHVKTANADLYQRVLKFFVLYALSDKQFAFDKIKMFCTPVIAYRLIPHYNKISLLLSIDAVSDLLRVYGTSIFNSEGSFEISSKHTAGRRLYDHTQSDISDEVSLENVTCGEIINIILQIMDDEVQEVRQGATVALCRLVERGLVVSSTLISRLLLKLFNPLTEKQDPKIQQMLSFSLTHYAQMVKDSTNVLENAIVPTLCSIGNAPKTSPLADISINSVLPFLAAITRSERNEFSNTHKRLAYSIFGKILNHPEDKCICVLSMMLQYLDEPVGNQIVIAELNTFVEKSLKIVTDKHVTKYLLKYSQKLAGYSVSTCRVTEASLATRASSQVNESIPEQMGSIHSCRATKGSLNSNRVTEDFIRSPAASLSLNEQNVTQRNETSDVDNLNESGSSLNLELAVLGSNRRSLRRLDAANLGPRAVKTRRIRKEAASDREKASTADSDSEDITPKKRWLRKRTNISQSAIGTTFNHSENINGSQNKSTGNLSGNESDTGNIRRSSRIKKNSVPNEINQSVIIYVPKRLLNKSKSSVVSTESVGANIPGLSRSARKSMEKNPISQLRSSLRSRSASDISRTSLVNINVSIRKSSRLAEKSVVQTPLNIQTRNSMRVADTSTPRISRTSTSSTPGNTRHSASDSSRTSTANNLNNRKSSRLAEKSMEKTPLNIQTRNSIRIADTSTSRISRTSTSSTPGKTRHSASDIPRTSTANNNLDIRKSSRLAEKRMEQTPLNIQTRNSTRTADTSTSRVSRTSTSSTPGSTTNTRKKQSKRNLEGLFKLTTRKSGNQLNLTGTSSNTIQMKTPNKTENCRANLKRFAKSETSDSECSSPRPKKSSKKKQKISKN